MTLQLGALRKALGKDIELGIVVVLLVTLWTQPRRVSSVLRWTDCPATYRSRRGFVERVIECLGSFRGSRGVVQPNTSSESVVESKSRSYGCKWTGRITDDVEGRTAARTL